MTQELRKRFFTSAPNPMLIRMVEEHELSTDKNNSEMSQMRLSKRAEGIIVELNAMHGKAKEKILELIQTLRSDGVKDHQIKKILFERISFISKSEIYRVLPQELKREYTKPLPKTINISSEHKVIDVEPEPQTVEALIPEVSQSIKETGTFEVEEDPKDTEIDFLKEKVTELEDALRKTEQFKPATALQEVHLNLTDPDGKFEEAMFNSLKKQADGVHSFYYDAYGIDLFKNRELSQLKNSGVKVFRRLYFEV